MRWRCPGRRGCLQCQRTKYVFFIIPSIHGLIRHLVIASTWSMPDPLTTLPPYTPRTPSSSNCKTYQSTDLFLAGSATVSCLFTSKSVHILISSSHRPPVLQRQQQPRDPPAPSPEAALRLRAQASLRQLSLPHAFHSLAYHLCSGVSSLVVGWFFEFLGR